MPISTISVARIIELGIPIAWQEAVEVAYAAHKRGADDSGTTPRGCVLTTAGDVELHSVPAGPENEAVSSSQLLALLLAGQAAPPELTALLASPHATFTGHFEADSLASFPSERRTPGQETVTLDWFVRPNPEAEIARLAERALAAAGERARLDELRTGARSQPKNTEGLAAASRRWQVRGRAVLAGVALAGLAGVGVWLTTGTGRIWIEQAAASWSQGSDEPASEADEAPATGPADGPAVAAKSPPQTGTPRAAAPAGRSEPPAAGLAAVPAPRPSSTVTGTAVDRPSAGASPLAADAAGENPPSATRGDVTVADAEPVPTSRVYSANDGDVDPPVMRHPQLPSTARADSTGTGSYVEVIVDERGEVTQVRLRASEPSLNDRMLVSAAKAWRFAPALKDGRPVPYRMQIPVTR